MIFGGAFAGDAFEVAAGAEGVERMFGKIAGFAPFADGGADILPEGAAKRFFGVNQGTILLKSGEAFVIDERGAGVEFLCGADGLDHGFDFAFEVMRLVNHVGDVGGGASLPFEKADFVEDAENLIGVDGAER